MNSTTLNKWNTTIKNFETAVEDFNRIASQNLDENEKKLENIQAVVKRELENLEKFNSYAEVKYQELSAPKCCDPTPLVIKQIGCILTVDMLIRVMSVACLAFFGESLTVVIISFVTYTVAEIIGVFGNILSFKYELEAGDIQFTNRIYHEKLEDFKQFDRVLEDFRNFQKFIAVTKFSIQNENIKHYPKSSSQDSLKEDQGDLNLNLQESPSNSNIQNMQALDQSSIIMIEESDNDVSKKLILEDDLEKNESSDTSSKNDGVDEISIDLTVPLINKKIAKCLRSYQKLPERFHSDETESYLFSNMVQKYPKDDPLLISLENITESDEVKIVNDIDSSVQNVHPYISGSDSSNLIQNLKFEQGNNENEQNGNHSRKNSNQLFQASKEQIDFLSNEFKERFKTKKLPAFIKLPTGSIISLS